MPPINTSTRTFAGGPTYTAGAGGTTATGTPYANQGAGTVNSVANGFQQFVQGGQQMMGGASEGGASDNSSMPQMPPYKSPILEKAKANASSAEVPKAPEWKKAKSIFDEDGSEGGGE